MNWNIKSSCIYVRWNVNQLLEQKALYYKKLNECENN